MSSDAQWYRYLEHDVNWSCEDCGLELDDEGNCPSCYDEEDDCE